MKLYFAIGACSFAPHIVLHELGIAHEAISVDLRTGEASDGKNIREVHPKGYVPALVLENGELLTECAAVLQFLAEMHPDAGLLPPPGLERARVQEWLNYIATELHKNFSALFQPDVPDDLRAATEDKLRKRFAIVEKTLEKRGYLTGEHFTVADAYLYTVSSWAEYLQVDVSEFRALNAYVAKVAERPSVVATRKAEQALVASV